jgi:hypothetical protein
MNKGAPLIMAAIDQWRKTQTCFNRPGLRSTQQHTHKFSAQWFAAVPFIGMLRKSVLMPKTAMALTIAASILVQTIGSKS